MAFIDTEENYIVFPDFWMFRNEGGWRWVSRDATRSSRAAFDFAPACMLDARHTLDLVSKPNPPKS